MANEVKEITELLKSTIGEAYANVFEEANKKNKTPMSEHAKTVQEIKTKKANRLMQDRKQAVNALNSTVNYLKGKK